MEIRICDRCHFYMKYKATVCQTCGSREHSHRKAAPIPSIAALRDELSDRFENFVAQLTCDADDTMIKIKRASRKILALITLPAEKHARQVIRRP